MTVLANAEAAEVEAKELERRAKRYWTLRYLMSLDHKASLPAVVYREGATAELIDYAARGTLRGAPVLADETPVLVRLGRIDPLRGWLVMDYVGPADPPSAGSDQNPA